MTQSPPNRRDFFYFHTMTTRWRDNDVYAHVNNAVFFEYVDTVVNHWLIQGAGLKVPGSKTVGLVVHSTCQYFSPLGFPDPVTGGLRVDRIGRTSVTYGVGLFRGDQEGAAALAAFTHVYVDRGSQRPEALDAGFREKLMGLKAAGQ